MLIGCFTNRKWQLYLASFNVSSAKQKSQPHGLAFCFGAENETRTRDPDLGKVVLYQLSYFRVKSRAW